MLLFELNIEDEKQLMGFIVREISRLLGCSHMWIQ